MLDQLDIFGSQIFLRFNKQQTYNTRLGTCVTLIIYVLIFYRLFVLIVDVVQRNNPEVIYNERQVDDPAIFEASSISFPIAFGMENQENYNYYIDESIYTISAFWNQKILTFNETTQQYVSTYNQVSINVQPCTIENFQNLKNQKYYLSLNYTNMYCLPPDLVLPIQGDFPSKVYSDIQITVKKCSKNCQSKEILDKFLQKSSFALQLSDSYVDPTISDNPFKIYSRDMFWATSTLLPKDAIVYIRNNYVYSDFGWFFPDVTTQRFPAYSFSESFEYPPSFQDYFLTIYFRFEKQKEGVYKRSYKKFNSILSEIGGFTQSFLAIGYIICKKISQTKLDIDLINKAFKFQGSLKSKQQNEGQQTNINEQQKQGNKKKLKKSKQSQESQNNSKVNLTSSDENLRKNNQTFKNNIQNFCYDGQIDESSQKQNLSQSPQQNSPTYQNQKSDKFYCDLNQQDTVLEQRRKQKSKQLTVSQQMMSYFKDKSIQLKKPVEKSDNQKQQINKMLSLKEQEKRKKQIEDQFKKRLDNQMSSIREKLYHNIDVFNIIYKLNELEKLKRLIFDQDQLKLFDYLPKPTIQTDICFKQNEKKDDLEIDLLYQDNRSELQKARESFQAYQNIAHKNDQSILDQKLINQLDPALKEMFKQLNEKYKNSFKLILSPQTSLLNNSTKSRFNLFEKQFQDRKDKFKKSDQHNLQFNNQTQESQIQVDEFDEIYQNNKKRKLNTFVSNVNQLSQL
ncbi:small GTP-binding domain protein (macronuclear) [Tetrahymena thermophila SB210]|uniref:Small GTP-binding domain protein n=1 Tax=Tetrahymena thermophila (strain SB210) TaxID=312017 RepID=W7XAK5_TETTS|nr:small GTP-binding domain protein [Tetrahymena thermophila SB210]EWS73443.1 small GTP-binding domain protein [Tetrahymena thermophila SB210]|eukprot:XP_012654014.1 small GTP-binding domain protein [Tetrahymena thermophila SB210]